MPEGIVIARVVRAWGNKGEVTAELRTDFPDRFDAVENVSLRRGATERPMELERYWFHKGRVILKFAGVDSISDAQTLAGCDVVITDEELYELPEGEDLYYDFDLVGCVLEDTHGTNVGEVTGVLRTGGGDVLEIRRPGGSEALVPFVDEICVDVDVAAKRIRVELPEGLLDL